MKVSACDKPDGQSAQYFELYKQSQSGSAVSQVCLGGSCVGSSGYAKSAQYSCSTPSACVPSAEVCDGKDNNCNGQADENNVCGSTAPATCSTSAMNAQVTCSGGAITADVKSGCRSVVCASGSNSILALACDKSGYFEVYKQASTGTPPKVCFGTTCIQNDGYAKSAACTTQPPSQPPTTTPPPTSVGSYPLKTNIVATTFWVGQGPSADTGWTNNYDSAWDTWWQEHYGGYDDPNNRNGYYPAGFTPKENPFYVAIPYTDYGDAGRKSNAFSVVPWSNEKSSWGSQESMIKNRWVRITKGGKTVYAQVENSGPGPTDDWQYVFGSNAQPTTDFGWKAGIDVSPAVRDYLTLGPVDNVAWQWVDASQVPAGPWKNIVTTRQSCWGPTMCP